MGNYRILQNDDHCLIQKRFWWFFWKTYTKWWEKPEYSIFKTNATLFNEIDTAENKIVALKNYDSKNKRKKNKYKIVQPKVDSPLWNIMNGEDDD